MKKRLCLLIACASIAAPVRGESTADTALPGAGFPEDRYTTLWTKSPFAIATPDASPSTDYQLVGLAQFDGVSYASLVDKQTQEHFVLTSEKPVRNLSLISISHGGPTSTAVIARAGERLILQEQNSSGTVAAPPPAPVADTPARVIPEPTFEQTLPARLRATIHRPAVVVPPRPASSS